jgi:hypothetical protein
MTYVHVYPRTILKIDWIFKFLFFDHLKKGIKG